MSQGRFGFAEPNLKEDNSFQPGHPLASAAACAIAAARALTAMRAHFDRLSSEQRIAVSRRLGARDEFYARALWVEEEARAMRASD